MVLLTLAKKGKRAAALLAFTLVFAMVFSLFPMSAEAVSRSELNALKQQQAQLAEEKAGIQAQLNALGSQVASQTEQLKLLSAQLEATQSEIENITRHIGVYTNSIGEMENELNKNRREKKELLERYKTRIRAMEENGSKSYIAILFGASSFQDLLGRIDCIREIMEYDNGLITDIEAAQVKIQNAKADMEAEMAAQEALCEEYRNKQAELSAQREEVEAVLESLEADSSEYQKQLESVSTLQSSIDGQISDMENQLAELERIRAEQAAASQNTSGNQGGNNQGWYSDSPGTGTGQDIVDYALGFLGVQYVYGGTSPSGFDCSGLVYYCYRHFGYTVNRTAAGLAYSGTEVSSSDLQPGDILLFTSSDGSYIGHTGLYIGGGQFVHAPHTGDVVKISSLSDDYYTRHYWGARRVIS
jgi:cell wall-associated NlpC family hydrolase